MREADPPVSLLSDPRVEEWLGSLSPEEVAASLSPEEVAAFLEAADEGPSSLEIGWVAWGGGGIWLKGCGWDSRVGSKRLAQGCRVGSKVGSKVQGAGVVNERGLGQT